MPPVVAADTQIRSKTIHAHFLCSPDLPTDPARKSARRTFTTVAKHSSFPFRNGIELVA